MFRKFQASCSKIGNKFCKSPYCYKTFAKSRQQFSNIEHKMVDISEKHFLKNIFETSKKLDAILLKFCGPSGAEVRINVNLVDLAKSFPIQRVFTCKNRRRYSRERASQSLEENSIHYSFASLGWKLAVALAGGCGDREASAALGALDARRGEGRARSGTEHG